MRGITFIDMDTGESRNTDSTWGLIMSAKRIGMPEPRIVKVDMADRDGEIDLSETLRGRVSYKNRPLSFSFINTDAQWTWQLEYSEIVRFVHGKRLKIIDPDTSTEYYIGRCTVSEPTYIGAALMFFDINVDADPYRLHLHETVVTAPMLENLLVQLRNEHMPVVPVITTDGDVTIRFGTFSTALTAGSVYRIPEITLEQGMNEIEIVSGTGTEITFTYRQGAI